MLSAEAAGVRSHASYHQRLMRVRHFVKYTFLRVDPAWRRLEDEQRAADKREFIAACADFADGHLLRSFSLVGTRGFGEAAGGEAGRRLWSSRLTV